MPSALTTSTMLASACILVLIATAATSRAEDRFRQPVYRVANQPERADSATAAPKLAADQPVFDLTQQPGEHPLAPVLRFARKGLEDIDANIQDYSCKVTKRERIDGELGGNQIMFVRVRHQPFSVYMFFVNPYYGREVLYVDNPKNYEDGQNKNKIAARAEKGLKRNLGIVHLDPTGHFAMDGQKYPITKFGIRNLTAELIEVAEQDVQYGECTVKVGNAKIDGRPVTSILVEHPVPRKNFRYHKAKIYIDNELRIPVAYASWMWPKQPGEDPPLEEQYIYTDIKINNGFTDETFTEQTPGIFGNPEDR
ncbi:MAG: DUF1571 domain-containing protein [Pirellulales bacterium]|nr:DUF1571 domain-containing protein [Pirellulales bacterium]